MPVPLVVPTYTIEDLERFPDDGNRYELLNGVLLVTPAPIPGHQIVSSRLLFELSRYLEPTRAAHVVGPGAVERSEDTHLEPDLLVFPSTERIGVRTKWSAIGSWWLAVEVFSRSSRTYDREYKRDAYLAMGVETVWLVDWIKQEVLVSQRGGLKDVRNRVTLVWHPSVLPAPLSIELNTIFEGLEQVDDWGS